MRAGRRGTSIPGSKRRCSASSRIRSLCTAGKPSPPTSPRARAIASATWRWPPGCRFSFGAVFPIAELLTLAGQGQLKDPAVLERQVQRMLADSRSEALVSNFTGQWLNVRGLQAAEPVMLLYPDFDDNLRHAFRREMELFFDSIVHEDRSILDLLTADYTFVDERLAKHYGIPNVYGSRFRRVTLGPELDMRRGLLGKGALLTITSLPARTSPVARGKWVMQTFLGVSPPDPPPNVPDLKPRKGDANAKEPTMRERLEQHRANPYCASCHKIFEPFGIALENLRRDREVAHQR